MAQVEQKLASLGIALPTPAAPIANYVGFVRTGSLLVVSGQICLGPSGTLVAKGKLGETVTVEQGQSAARTCAINLLAQVKIALATSTRWYGSCGLAASSIRRRRSSTGRRS